MKDLLEQTLNQSDIRWIQVIKVRSVGDKSDELEIELRDLISAIEIQTRSIAKAYFRASVEGDFSVHLIHQKKELVPAGSELGIKLVGALREFGFVSHRVWIELPSSNTILDY